MCGGAWVGGVFACESNPRFPVAGVPGYSLQAQAHWEDINCVAGNWHVRPLRETGVGGLAGPCFSQRGGPHREARGRGLVVARVALPIGYLYTRAFV